MILQESPFFIPLLIAALINGSLAYFGWKNRDKIIGLPFALLMGACTIWTIGYAVELVFADFPTGMFLTVVQYLGIATVPVAWLLVVLVYTGRDHFLTKRNLALLFAIPALVVLLVATNPYHHLYYSLIAPELIGNSIVWVFYRGPLFWLHTTYSYALMIISVVFLSLRYFDAPRIYKKQVLLLIIAAMIPLLANAMYIVGYDPVRGLDLTPFTFTISGLIIAIGIFRFELFSQVPVTYPLVFTSMSDGIIVVDTKNRIMDLNPAAQSIIGNLPSSPVGCLLADILPGVMPLLADEQMCILEVHKEISLSRHGRLYVYDGVCRPVRALNRAPQGYLIILRDITESRNAQEELKQNEAKFRLISENSQDIICLHCPDTRFVYISPAVKDILGYNPEELVGTYPSGIIHPDDANNFTYTNPHPPHNGATGNTAEFRVRTKDGDWRCLESTIKPVVAKDGSISGIQSSSRDITDRKKTEQALHTSEERFRSLVETTSDIIWEVDTQLRYTYVSPKIKTILGYEPSEVTGKTPFDFMPPDEATKVRFVLEKTVSTQTPFAGMVNVNLHRDGHLVVIETNGEPFFDDTGGFKGFRGVNRDIVDRQKIQHALEVANKKLYLLSSVTRHDIRNKLTALSGYIELAKEECDPGRFHATLPKMEQILTFIDDGLKFTYDYQEMGMKAPVWQNVLDLVIIARGQVDVKGAMVMNNLDGLEVFADPLLNKVIYNLMENAARHGEHVTTIRFSAEPRGEMLALICADDGVGISDTDKPKLFRRGFGKHTGLGLFLIREILAITGITITENGTPGDGARFEILIPQGMFRYI
ncbi:MAG: histidine kinase N-terminal 7TM domain-containing protein [Methanoregula sp.]|jgi:PAS domain S-box-containing protein